MHLVRTALRQQTFQFLDLDLVAWAAAGRVDQNQLLSGQAVDGGPHVARGGRYLHGQVDDIGVGAELFDGGGTLQVGALEAVVTVTVRGGAGKLDAWIDFDRDGSWGGVGERIAATLPVANGANAVTFDVPSWAQDGLAYARFRLSTAGGLGVGGEAANGEVEDYQLTIAAPAAMASSSPTGKFSKSDGSA